MNHTKKCFFVTLFVILYVAVFCPTKLIANEQYAGADDEWWRRFKHIDTGSGILDIGATYRILAQRWTDFDLKSYAGTNRTDRMLSERLWLDFNWQWNTNNRVFLQLQDARSTLSDYSRSDFSPHCSIENPFDVREIFIEFKKILDTPLGIKAGRQRIAYADQLVWGPGDWSNSGKFTYDAIKLSWEDAYLRLDTIWAKRVLADPECFDSEHDSYEAGGAYISIKKLPVYLDIFYVLKHDSTKIYAGESETNSLALHAVGTRIETKEKDGLFATVTSVAEFGDWGNSDIRSYAYATKAGYRFTEPINSAIMVSYAVASGDSDPLDNKHETYDPLFQAVHIPFGLMDVVSWKNLHDLAWEFSIKPISGLCLTPSYHIFKLDEARDAWYWSTEKPMRRDKTGSSGTDLGDEFDLTVAISLSNWLKLEAVYGRFVPGDFIKQTGGYRNADWVSLQTLISF